jgi:hypothetical protein
MTDCERECIFQKRIKNVIVRENGIAMECNRRNVDTLNREEKEMQTERKLDKKKTGK